LFKHMPAQCWLLLLRVNMIRKRTIGKGKYTRNHPAYRYWDSIHTRVKDLKSYDDVTIQDEWYVFQNFAKWCETQKGFNQLDLNSRFFVLDKDIKSDPKNRRYSESTCSFIPQCLNAMFLKSKKTQYKGSQGVYADHIIEEYIAVLRLDGVYVEVGSSPSFKEAYEILMKARKEKLKSIIDKYKDKLDDHVIESILSHTPPLVYPSQTKYIVTKTDYTNPRALEDYYWFEYSEESFWNQREDTYYE
jgi:hypothetical protein